jgi:hypothetical protein
MPVGKLVFRPAVRLDSFGARRAERRQQPRGEGMRLLPPLSPELQLLTATDVQPVEPRADDPYAIHPNAVIR